MRSLVCPTDPHTRHAIEVLEREGREKEILPLCLIQNWAAHARQKHWQMDIEEPNCEHCIDILTKPNERTKTI